MTRAHLALLVVLTAGGCSLAAEADARAQKRGPDRSQPSVNMSGTFEWDRSRGDDPARVVDLATRDLPAADRRPAYDALLARVHPPATLAIDRVGRTVTIASSNHEPASFTADGQTRNETQDNGRVTATRAVFIGDQLSVSSRGNRATDFLVTLEPLDDGAALVMTRRISGFGPRDSVRAHSYYRRVSETPRWDLYETPVAPFAVPDGTHLTATLNAAVSTRTARRGDRLSMTVQGPVEYRDATIDAVVTSVTRAGSNRAADLHVDFVTIQLSGGQIAGIDARLETVRTPGGETLRVDGPGPAARRRTAASLEQGALGAAIGGVIGVIAGGSRGAVIGAVIGGAGGAILAGSRGRFLDLPAGTEVTLVTSALLVVKHDIK